MVTSPHARPSAAAAPDDRPSHVADLLRLVVREPGRPRLTWYGDDGERVELSGAVLENWINKTTNLLVEEFDAEPSTCVVLDLGVHWRAVVWAAAAWRTGATLVVADVGETVSASLPAGAPRPDVVVTARPADWAGSGAQLVAVALPALARRFDGELPPGSIDAASAVMTYGDQLGWVPAVDPGTRALVGSDGHDVEHRSLLTARSGVAPAPGARVLLRGDGTVTSALRGVLDVLACDGSLVLLSPGRARLLDEDDDVRRRLVESERVTQA
ncbi:TIGR03089 family protein [Cellulosimicrobium arenosum]|uniref:TIGR03089 family protein n=1 Tax=Cellulosimicrobium arenosum TaxID=2708133 RepID=A0A927J1J4_9MICO|nr:TIGR03089 family protein [Cellulosimicrobium arenosum]MBD8080201.1 TIGR03089 family protein [Cellulosimicrobium arenosum]